MICNNCNSKNCKCSRELEIASRIKEFNENYPIFEPNFPGSIRYQIVNKYLYSNNLILNYTRQVNAISTPFSSRIEPCGIDLYFAGKANIQVEYNNYLVANCTFDIPGIIPKNVSIPFSLDNSFYQDNTTTKYLFVTIKPLTDIYIRELVLNTTTAGIPEIKINPCNVLRLLTFYTENVDIIKLNVKEVCQSAYNYINNSPGIVFKPLVSYGQLFRSSDLEELLKACFFSLFLSNISENEVVLDEELVKLQNANKSIDKLFTFDEFDIFKYVKKKISDIYSRKISEYEKQIKNLEEKVSIKNKLNIYID